MEIRGEKEKQYIKKLYLDFENQGIRERVQEKIEDEEHDYSKREKALLVLKEAKKEIPWSKQRYTKSEIAEFLNHSTDTYAHEFINKLEEHDVLEDAGKRKTGSNQVDTWKLDKGRLLDEYVESDEFQQFKELNASALDHSGEAWKIH